MIILYDEHGRECKFNYPIDARQAVDSGMYFTEHPGKKKENKHFALPVEEKKEEVVEAPVESSLGSVEETRRGRKLKSRDDE